MVENVYTYEIKIPLTHWLTHSVDTKSQKQPFGGELGNIWLSVGKCVAIIPAISELLTYNTIDLSDLTLVLWSVIDIDI